MIIAIGVLLLACIIVFLVIHRKKLVDEFEKRIQDFQQKICLFFDEYLVLKSHVVEEAEEQAFFLKWQDLYKETCRYKSLGKSQNGSDIVRFIEVFKNLHHDISKSNAEIKRKESIKPVSEQINIFFEDLSKLKENYISFSQREIFKQKFIAICEIHFITGVIRNHVCRSMNRCKKGSHKNAGQNIHFF